jgi:malonyl-CoA/methylmalonyl-CoA synthetase
MFPALESGGARTAVRVGERAVSYDELAVMTAGLGARIAGARLVAVWAESSLEACLALVAALRAGVPAVPINPRSGARELAHVVADSSPDLLLVGPSTALPEALDGVPRLVVSSDDRAGALVNEEHDPEAAALVVYTSGTTGSPKGVVLPRRAITSNLDTLAAAWEWTGDDVLVHGLPLFHVHGLVLGLLGPLRLGGTVHHLGRFSPEGAAAALREGATMLFGVPTMYHRLAAADSGVADALRGARLLVSGSAALPASLHARIEAATGQRVVERYGMTETLMNCGVRAWGDRRPGFVGPPLDGVELRLVDLEGSGAVVEGPEAIGEIQVRGPNLFTGYLNRPDATAAAHTPDGWFITGDVAAQSADGYVRIVGRKATDLIKSGGFKIGAGEIENVLLEHPAVAEVAVTGEPDAELGERVVAWVVLAAPATEDELVGHVAEQLAPHKRPRAVRFLDALPRNDLGKIMKTRLQAG